MMTGERWLSFYLQPAFKKCPFCRIDSSNPSFLFKKKYRILFNTWVDAFLQKNISCLISMVFHFIFMCSLLLFQKHIHNNLYYAFRYLINCAW